MVEVEATYEYIAEQPDELTIKVGDIIKNVIQSEGGWWEGELKGKKGMFPDNFVKVLKDGDKDKKEEVVRREPKKDIIQASKRQSVKDLANRIKDKVHDGPAPVRKKVKKRAKVVFAYEPENEDELKLQVGDSVEILKQEEEGWWEGIVNGKQGMIPSNFVEIVDESEPSTVEPVEKAEAGDGEGHIIKGKKIHGVGLGNIFGDGPIKLRSTTGNKPLDKPIEPVRMERPTQEPIERRPKENPLAVYTDGEQMQCANENYLTYPASRTMYQVNKDLMFIDCDDVGLIENIHNELCESNSSFNCNDINKSLKDELIEAQTNLKSEHSKYSFILPKAPLLGGSTTHSDRYNVGSSPKISNCSEDRGEFGDSLHSILEELDNCLDLSYQPHRPHKGNIDNVIEQHSSVHEEPDCSVLGLICDRDDDDDINNSCVEEYNLISTSFDNTYIPLTLLTPLHSTFTPENQAYSQAHGSSPFVSPAKIPPGSQPTLPPLKETPRTNFASLNRSGNLSPYIHSIAHKYHIFDTPKTDTSREDQSDAKKDNTDDEAEDYQKADAGPTRESDEIQGDINKMVSSYVYDVLGTGYAPGLNHESHEIDGDLSEESVLLCMTQKLKNSPCCFDNDTEGLDDDSVAVCLDENSIRLIDTSSKENLDDFLNERPSIMEDYNDEEPGALMSMMDNGSNPDITNYDTCPYTQSTPIKEHANIVSTHNVSLPVRLTHVNGDSCPRGHRSILKEGSKSRPWPSLPQSGLVKQTSSYGRISFSNDTPSFWFKKDSAESPPHKDNHFPANKARSPKRTISDLKEKVPSLLELAERVYLDDFKGKVESFKAENPHLVLIKEGQSHNDSSLMASERSPAKKKRRKTISDSHLEHCNRISLNFNQNAVEEKLGYHMSNYNPYDEFGTIETFFGSKEDVPIFMGFQPASKILEQKLKLQKDSEKEQSKEVKEVNDNQNNNNSAFDDSIKLSHLTIAQNENNSALDNAIDYNDVTPQNVVISPGNRSRADYLLMLGTSEESVRFAKDCSEKRRKRIFGTKSKEIDDNCPVKLISFRKLEEENEFRPKICSPVSQLYPSNKTVSTEPQRASVHSPEEVQSNYVHRQGLDENLNNSLTNNIADFCSERSEEDLLKQKKLILNDYDCSVDAFFDHGDLETDQPDQDVFDTVSNKEPDDKEATELQYCESSEINDYTICSIDLNKEKYACDMQQTSDQDLSMKNLDVDISNDLLPSVEPKEGPSNEGPEACNDERKALNAVSELSDGEEEEESILNRSFVCLKDAYQKHKQLSDSFTQGDGNIVDLIEARNNLYGAISDTVFICSDILSRSKLEQYELESVEDHNGAVSDVDQKGSDAAQTEIDNYSSNTTPDADALLKDLQNIDLSGTPQYLEEEGPDKVFLKHALESLDNLLINNSFSSLGDSPKALLMANNGLSSIENSPNPHVMANYSFSSSEDLPKVDEKRMSSIGIQTECLDIFENSISEWKETKDASSMTVFGTKCYLHQPSDSFNESSQSPERNDISLKNNFTDDTVEVLDDSILNIVGRPCTMHEDFMCSPDCSDASITSEKGSDSSSEILEYPSIEPFMLKIKHVPSPCYYDEVVELDGSDEEGLYNQTNDSDCDYVDNDYEVVEESAVNSEVLQQSSRVEQSDVVHKEACPIQHVEQPLCKDSATDVLYIETDVDAASAKYKSPDQVSELDLYEPLHYSSPVASEYEDEPSVSDIPDISDLGQISEDPLADNRGFYRYMVNSSNKENINPEQDVSNTTRDRQQVEDAIPDYVSSYIVNTGDLDQSDDDDDSYPV